MKALLLICAFTSSLVVSAAAQMVPVALIRHAPTLNGTVDGSILQVTAESVTLNGGAIVTGDLFLPGTPAVRLNGNPSYGGTVDGTGYAAPSNYQVTLNGNAGLHHVVRRTDPVALPIVLAPPPPTGTRTVAINGLGQSAGDFSTLRNFTLNGGVGQYPVPPGTYGDFTANGNSGFTLGVAGATQPVTYAFQHLTLNGNTALQVDGPVVVTVANGISVNGRMGAAANPAWLVLRLAAGGVTLNGNVTISGCVIAPTGTVTLNGNSRLAGGLTCDRLTLNGGSVLQLVDLAPDAMLTAPANGANFMAPAASIMLQATANDRDGFIAKVEFFAGTTKLGATTTPPYQFAWTNVPAGTYVLTAKATDNAGGSSTSASVNIIVNAPPAVALTQPADAAVVAAPGSVTLAAYAADSDGRIAKVEFFAGATKLGETTVAPYQLVLTDLAAGAYTFTASATDDRGAGAVSAPVSILVQAPLTAAVTAPSTVARGNSVMLSASASDPGGTVARVEFFRDGESIGAVTTPSGTPPTYAFTDASALSPGLHTYSVRAYNDHGLFADSPASIVTILPTLPYSADFEAAEGYAAGPLDGQRGWSVAAGTVAVADDPAFSGSQSVLLVAGTPPVQMAQTFAPYPGHDIVFVDLFARPAAGTSWADSTNFDFESARFAFQRAGAAGVLQAFDGDGTGGGQWQATGFAMPLGSDNQTQDWIHLTARLDFTHKVWDLYAAGKMVAADVRFRDNATFGLSSLAIRGSTVADSRIDFLYAGADNPLFADANSDGIDDGWETAHGLSLDVDNRHLMPAGNGVSVVEAYVRGTDPNDYYQGLAPTLTKLGGDNQVAPAGQFNPQPLAVSVFDSTGTIPLVNAQVAFSVTQGGGQLATTDTGTPSLATAITLRTGADGTAGLFYQQPAAGNISSRIEVAAGAALVAFGTASAASINDADGNGLPDDWETRYFGQTGVDSNADADGDGISNLQEYLNGTDPTDFYNGVVPQVTAENNGAPGSNNELSMIVRRPDGTVWGNAPVTFRITSGERHISATAGGPLYSSVIQVRADSEGIARVYLEPL